MEILLQQIDARINEFTHEAKKGNKAASRRARKLSLEIEKLMKQYRKESIL